MGKKSKNYKQTKAKREAYNGTVNSLDEINYNRPVSRRNAANCMHEVRDITRLNPSQRRRYMEQGSAIARFGQSYSYQSTLLPNLTDLSVVFIHITGKECGLIDKQFVGIAHASPVTEILDDGDYELARFKTELGIVSKTFLQVGEEEFNRCLPNPIFPNQKPMVPPEWVTEMEATLEKIRRRNSALLLYLASQVPCKCLDKLVPKAKKEEEEAAVEVEEKEVCDHGFQASDTTMMEEWQSEAKSQLLKFAISHSLKEDGTYRDLNMLANFFQENPLFTTSGFAKFAFCVATNVIVENKKHEWAERMVNLGLMAEVYAQHGPEHVDNAIQRMHLRNPQMEPYLYDFYVEMRKTNAVSSLLRLLQKEIPCECLDKLRTIVHGEGSDRKEICNVCYKPTPKSNFLSCSGCCVEEYCSLECQKQDWEKHKVVCKRLASALKLKQQQQELESC